MSKQLKVMLDDGLRDLLERAAARRGVGLAQEIRLRLWYSFATAPEFIDALHARQAALYVDAWQHQDE